MTLTGHERPVTAIYFEPTQCLKNMQYSTMSARRTVQWHFCFLVYFLFFCFWLRLLD